MSRESKEDFNSSDENDSLENSSRDIDVDVNASFFATFMDGSSLRYLIEYLRSYSLEGTFVFDSDYVLYQKEDEDQTIINDVKIKTYELTDYEFSSSNPVSATISLSDLRNKTRTVGKKEQLDIYRRPEEPSNFYIQVRSQEKSSDNPVLYCMPMRNGDVTIYEFPTYTKGKHNPNCTIYQTDFSKVCKALIANKCSFADFIGYEKGMIIKGYSADGKIAMVKEYGKCRSVSETKTSTSKSIVTLNERIMIKPKVAPPKLNIRDSNEVERFRIYNDNIKRLTKINGFSPNGTIKFYMEKDLPMKLVCGIGAFGRLTVLIRTAEEKKRK